MAHRPMIYFPEDVKKYGVETALIIGALSQCEGVEYDMVKQGFMFPCSLKRLASITGLSLEQVETHLPTAEMGWEHQISHLPHGDKDYWGRVIEEEE